MSDTAVPAYVMVRYDRGDQRRPRDIAGYLADTTDDDTVALMLQGTVPWEIPADQVIAVTVLRPAHDPAIPVPPEPSIMEQLLAAVTLTPLEAKVLTILRDHGGPVQHRDVPDIVRYHGGQDHLEPGRVLRILQSLKHKGRVRLVPSAGLTSGVIHLT